PLLCTGFGHHGGYATSFDTLILREWVGKRSDEQFDDSKYRNKNSGPHPFVGERYNQRTPRSRETKHRSESEKINYRAGRHRPTGSAIHAARQFTTPQRHQFIGDI